MASSMVQQVSIDGTDTELVVASSMIQQVSLDGTDTELVVASFDMLTLITHPLVDDV